LLRSTLPSVFWWVCCHYHFRHRVDLSYHQINHSIGSQSSVRVLSVFCRSARRHLFQFSHSVDEGDSEEIASGGIVMNAVGLDGIAISLSGVRM